MAVKWIFGRRQEDEGHLDGYCHKCGAPEGELHEPCCSLERCPFCFGQLLGCGCVERHVGDAAEDDGMRFSAEQMAQWEQILLKKGLLPYVERPNLCIRCGLINPNLFMVPDAEWEHFVPPTHQDDLLCITCYRKVQELFPKGWEAVNE